MLSTSNGTPLMTEGTVFAQGGEGELFLAMGKYKGMIFKRYFKHINIQEKERKIDYMLQNSPLQNAHAALKKSIVWPEEKVYENGVFSGYLMPVVQDTVALQELCRHKIKYNRIGEQWKKFDPTHSDSMRIRLRIVSNVACALQLIHESGNYVLKDFKPDNVQVNIRGIVSLVDMDSIQIDGRNGDYFPAGASTKEYCPPEDKDTEQQRCQPSWDYFSFAVTAYRILVLAHPFSMIPIKNPLDLDEHIKRGYYAHTSPYKEKLDAFHTPFLQLPAKVQATFHQCFQQGLFQAGKRPSFADWIQVIQGNLDNTIPVPTCELHVSSVAVEFGEKVSLTWQSKNGENASINGVEVDSSGCFDVAITGDTTFHLKVTNSLHSVDKKVKVQATAIPKIELTADAYRVERGRKLSVKWKIEPRKGLKKIFLNGERFRWQQYKSVRIYKKTRFTLEVHYHDAIITKELVLKIKKKKN